MLGVGFWVWNASGEVPVSTGCWAAPTWEAKPSSRDSAAILGKSSDPSHGQQNTQFRKPRISLSPCQSRERAMAGNGASSSLPAGDLELPQLLLLLCQ